MSRYRILEKKGEHKTVTVLDRSGVGYGSPNGEVFDTSIGEYEKDVYIPRYIVQEHNNYHGFPEGIKGILYQSDYKDLKEFNNLEEAKKYKRDLELEEGIVIE